MYKSEGRFCRLIELNSDNDLQLFKLIQNNSSEYRKLVSKQEIPETYPDFINTLRMWFSSGRLYQFIVYGKRDNEPVGTFFFYNHNTTSKSVKISAFFEKKSRGKLVVAESLMMAASFARHIIRVNSLSFTVYSENGTMIRIAKKIIGDNTNSISEFNENTSKHTYEMQSSTLDNILCKLKKLNR